MIVDSCDSRKEPARSPHDALAGPIKSYRHRTVILWLPQGDGTMIVRSSCDVSTISTVRPIISCWFHFNICLQAMSLIPPLSVTQYGHSSVFRWKQSNHGRIQRGWKITKIFFFCNTGPDPVENHKATHVPSQHYMTGQHLFASKTPFKVTFR